MADLSVKREREDEYGSPDAKRQHLVNSPVETVFRVVVPTRKVGSVLGKGGQTVKTIRDETKSNVRVCESVPSCEDRVLIIAAPEVDLAIPENNAQTALMRVHDLLFEAEDAQSPQGVTTRILVCQTQAGSIIGKNGKTIKDIRESSGASVKLLAESDLPLCALHNDRILEISGALAATMGALKQVGRQIRENPPRERPGGATPALHALLQGGFRR